MWKRGKEKAEESERAVHQGDSARAGADSAPEVAGMAGSARLHTALLHDLQQAHAHLMLFLPVSPPATLSLTVVFVFVFIIPTTYLHTTPYTLCPGRPGSEIAAKTLEPRTANHGRVGDCGL